MEALKREDINIMREKESYIGAELYRILKNSLALVGKHSSNFVLEDVIPQYPVDENKADFVVICNAYRQTKPFLVIETKQRAYTRIGPSYTNATKQAKKYAEQLEARYFGIYDGWMLMVFDSISPYLIGVYSACVNTTLNEVFTKNLLLGLLDLYYSGKKNGLNRLSKFGDVDFLWKKILPSVAKMFIKEQAQELKEKYGTEIDKQRETDNLLEHWKGIFPF